VQEAMVFKRVDHIEIVTDRPDLTLQFYTEVLGFRVKAKDRIERPGSALNLVY
jgi:catechol 2,3-dioxygenase-like lactoylglutathione lyase family enzyme